MIASTSRVQRIEVEGLERCGVIEVGPHRIGHRRVLAQNLQVELIGPPVTVAGAFGRVVADAG